MATRPLTMGLDGVVVAEAAARSLILDVIFICGWLDGNNIIIYFIQASSAPRRCLLGVGMLTR